VLRYLAGIPDRQKIQLMTIDMWNPYREAIHEALPDARIVVDKFHVVRMANEALERIRKEHRVNLPTKGRLQLKDDRWMMLTNPDKLDAGRALLLEEMLSRFPLLKAGYEAKERFRAIWQSHSVEDAEAAYDEWEAKLLLMHSCHKTERPAYERGAYVGSGGSGFSMSRVVGMIPRELEPTGRWLGVELSTLVAELRKLPKSPKSTL